MAKGQKRSNREIRRPKQDKAPPKAENAFGDQIKLPANADIPRDIGNTDRHDAYAERREMAMKIVIEFYRTRDADDAHAVVGRETAETADLDSAIEIARQLSQTLDMPQRPDAMTITDVKGAPLYSGVLEAEATNEGRMRS